MINEDYKGNDSPFIVIDESGYYYKTTCSNLKKGSMPRRFIKSNPYTIENIKLWCKINEKPFALLSEEYENNSTKMEWKCLKDSCLGVFYCAFGSISMGKGCGICHGKQVSKANSLLSLRPDLASEWDFEKNGKLTPSEITCGSAKKIWWKCLENKNHSWQVAVFNRNDGYGCPYCAGQLPSDDYNLLKINPNVCKEWDYNKNINNPSDYTPNSGKKVWWKCNICNKSWFATISHRTSKDGRGCPHCNLSKGEIAILNFLDKNIINYTQQKIFEGLLGVMRKNLSYDFYLPGYNLLIEYQGEFHDGKAKLQTPSEFKKQKEHDKRKREYAKNNNINLLEIWYWDIDNIEKILNKELKIENHTKRIRND